MDRKNKYEGGLNESHFYFAQMDKSKLDIFELIHSEAYPPEMRFWNKELLQNDVLIEKHIWKYSFLLYDRDWVGHCIAVKDISLIEPDSGQQVLFIGDLAVRPDYQRRGYGRLLAQEALRRACEDNIERVELCARESTSLRAINASSQTDEILRLFGLTKSEYGRHRFNEQYDASEYGRLISLDKS